VALENRTNPVLDKLARALLASSCLAGAAGIANASTIITEGIPPAPALFPTSAPGYLLPLGTTEVIGALCTGECGSDTEDVNFFEFQGLLPASSFVITPVSGGFEGGYEVLSSTPVDLGGCDFESGCHVSGAVPADGKLVIETYAECGECGTVSYQINLTASLAPAPEPSTLPAVGLALAGALAWRRRRTRVN
jgi:hypothetical protein